MPNRLNILIMALLLTLTLLAGCAKSTTLEPVATSEWSMATELSKKLNVTVSILPQKYFVERVGGEHVVVNVMVEPGNSPATYEPKPGQLTALNEAVAYFSIGVPYENAWLDKIASANDEMLMVDTKEGIELVPIDAHYKVDLGGRPESDAEGRDPHIWLSPELVKIQAQNIYAALVEIDPINEADYKANLNSFLSDIDELIADIESTLMGITSHRFMVFHPAWGYFGDDFELEMIPIEVGGQEPSAAELAALVIKAKVEEIQVIFAQPEFSTEDAETIAKEINGEVLLISALNPNWLDNLRHVAATFAEVLSK